MELLFIDTRQDCPLCLSSHIESAFNLEAFGKILHWDHCLDCGLTFQNPRLDSRSLAQIYNSNEYWGESGDNHFFAYSRYTEKEPVRIKQGRRRIRLIKKITGLRAGRLLDVGSATGFFPYVARQYGFEPIGIEPSEQMAAYARKNYGLDVRPTTLEGCELPMNHFDLVTLWATDSHFEDPRRDFAKLVGSLKPDGFLAMNYQDFAHWIRLILPGIKKSWNALYNFTEPSLKYLFNQVGLDVVYHKMEWQVNHLDHIFQVLKLNAPGFMRKGVMFVPAFSFNLVIARKR